MSNDKLPDPFLVKPRTKVRLRDFDTAWFGTKETRKLGADRLKEEAQEFLQKNIERLSRAQELLWASDKYSVLIVLQAMDAAGKDGLIKHVMSGINPQGCQVFAFKQPTAEELRHNYLWRYAKCLPERGRIGIFNRSHYEEVLVVRVHPELLEHQNLTSVRQGRGLWKERYEDINAFEEHLARNGTVILKFFLHISKKEQKRRFLERIENPAKNWKFSGADLAERAHWKEYVEAYEDAISATSTKHAPWHIIPADHKWVTRWLVAKIVTHTIEGLRLKFPQTPQATQTVLRKAKLALARE